MRRRSFILAIAAFAAWPFAARAKQADAALTKAMQDYGKIPHPSEADRADYITRLVRMRENAIRLNTGAWLAIDAEVKLHPAPPDSDGKALAALMAGSWRSGRHDTLYRTDGTWTLLPADPGTLHGTWRIDGNQYTDTSRYSDTDTSEQPQKDQYTIILITRTDLVFTDQKDVFYETRLK
jgi:hypothetical protein